MHRTDRRGFTLLEVMVALLVLALALVALLRLSGLEARALTQVRDSTLAQWVAANAIADARLQRRVPSSGRSEGRALMGLRRWRWQMDVQATDDPALLRLDVRVFPEDARSGEPVAALTGFYRQ